MGLYKYSFLSFPFLSLSWLSTEKQCCAISRVYCTFTHTFVSIDCSFEMIEYCVYYTKNYVLYTDLESQADKSKCYFANHFKPGICRNQSFKLPGQPAMLYTVNSTIRQQSTYIKDRNLLDQIYERLLYFTKVFYSNHYPMSVNR